jgi:hypothetical protein
MGLPYLPGSSAVLLATGSLGSLYLTAHANTTGWEAWRSFYH